MGYKWKLLQRTDWVRDPKTDELLLAETMRLYEISREEAMIKIMEEYKASEVWTNDLYQVQTKRWFHGGFRTEVMHLNIRRRDGAPIFDWRHRQLIKNQLLGPECEALEIYPAESRLIDESNKYHLFGFLDPTFRIPFGIETEAGRSVVTDEIKSPPGFRQRRV